MILPKLKINLGCESQIIDGWVNLDPRWQQFEGAKYWEWNKPIPCADESTDLVLVQHVLMYCSPENYEWNLKEIYRILCRGGKFLLKEDDNRKHIWRKIGTKHKTGHILGSTNPDEIKQILSKVGFGNFVMDPAVLITKYGDIINRQRRLLKGTLFVIESEK